MKIGEVSRRYGISIDTLNYYIQFGLLVPPKKGGQRDFDARTISELEQILSLKELRFTLQEIYRIITMSRISHFASEEDQSDLAALYRLKREQCLKEAQAYSEAARILSEKISSLQIPVVSSRNTGVPLRMFDLLRCPDCGNPFTVSNPVMDSASMDSADLSCSCGYQAKIRSGIVITDSSGPRPYDKADVNRETYRDLPPDLPQRLPPPGPWAPPPRTRPAGSSGTGRGTAAKTGSFSRFASCRFFPSPPGDPAG